MAIINARDVNDPTGFGQAGAVTAIKMSSVSIDGLKQAFLDPESRVRLLSQPDPGSHTEFVSIEWAGGFLDGLSIDLNRSLNVLIGGRGSGKSTVIESIRYVLDLKPIGKEAGSAHESVVANVLRPGTQITLTLRSPHPSLREYVIRRVVPNPPTVTAMDGEPLPLKPRDVAPHVDVFGQHEISELARNPDERTRLLRRFLDTDASGPQKEELLGRLATARARFLKAVQERDKAQQARFPPYGHRNAEAV